MVEVAISLTVLAALAGLTASLMAAVSRGNDELVDETRALAAARAAMAAVRAMPVPASLPSETRIDAPSAAGSLRNAAAEASWRAWEPGIAEARVTFAWENRRGVRRKIELTTLLSGGPGR